LRDDRAFHSLRAVRRSCSSFQRTASPAHGDRQAGGIPEGGAYRFRREGIGRPRCSTGLRNAPSTRGSSSCGTMQSGRSSAGTPYSPVIHAAGRYGAALARRPGQGHDNDRIAGGSGSLPARSAVRNSGLYRPQDSTFALLQEAHMKARADRFHARMTLHVVERKGTRVKIVPRSETNIKITNPDDRKTGRIPAGVRDGPFNGAPKAAPPLGPLKGSRPPAPAQSGATGAACGAQAPGFLKCCYSRRL